MAKSTVAILRTTPATATRHCHSATNLAGFQDVVAPDAATALGETAAADANGCPGAGPDVAQIDETGSRALLQSIGILGTCIREAPESATRRRAKDAATSH